MHKRKVLFGALLICFSGLVACGHTASPRRDYARDNLEVSPLKAEIKLAQATVKNHETFSVSTTLINSSSTVWMLNVPMCGYSSAWRSDNPSVLLAGESCLKNAVSKIYLKPGETFEKTVPVRVELADGNAQPESVTFRLGFKDPTCWSAQGIPPNWSNAVTVSVTR
jgi:archaellum component FlaF (FlaF/FlaG flagellin family)